MVKEKEGEKSFEPESPLSKPIKKIKRINIAKTQPDLRSTTPIPIKIKRKMSFENTFCRPVNKFADPNKMKMLL